MWFYEYHFLVAGEAKIIYAASEKVARKEVEKYFGEKNPELIKRENW